MINCCAWLQRRWEEQMRKPCHLGPRRQGADRPGEKGWPWAAQVDLLKGGQFAAEYLMLHSKRVVRTLVHDGNGILELTVIGEYIDDAFPEPPLNAAARLGRLTMLTWTEWLGAEVESATSPQFDAASRVRRRRGAAGLRQFARRYGGIARNHALGRRPRRLACQAHRLDTEQLSAPDREAATSRRLVAAG